MSANKQDYLTENALLAKIKDLERQIAQVRTQQLVGSEVVVPTLYSAVASGDLSLTMADQDIPGVTITFTPPREAILAVQAAVHFTGGVGCTDDLVRTTWGGSGGITITGLEYYEGTIPSVGKSITMTPVLWIAGTGASLTIKLQAKNVTAARGTVDAGASGSEVTRMRIIYFGS